MVGRRRKCRCFAISFKKSQQLTHGLSRYSTTGERLDRDLDKIQRPVSERERPDRMRLNLRLVSSNVSSDEALKKIRVKQTADGAWGTPE